MEFHFFKKTLFWILLVLCFSILFLPKITRLEKSQHLMIFMSELFIFFLSVKFDIPVYVQIYRYLSAFESYEDNVGRFTCTGSKWISGSLENLSPGLESFRHSWWGSQLAPSRNSPKTSTPFSGAWLPCKDCSMGSLSSKKFCWLSR